MTLRRVVTGAVVAVIAIVVALVLYSYITKPTAIAVVDQRWKLLEKCDPTTNVPARSRVVRVDISNSRAGVDPLISASWNPATRVMYLPASWRDSLYLVDHEIQHARHWPLVPAGKHPKEIFDGKCGDLMRGRPLSS